MRHVGGPRFVVSSAGTNPAGFVHPLVFEAMATLGISADGQKSKGIEEIARDKQHIVITLCDHAASQPCPQWTGAPITVHWSLPDPSFHPGSDEDRRNAAISLAQSLKRRLGALATLPLETMSREDVEGELLRLGDTW